MVYNLKDIENTLETNRLVQHAQKGSVSALRDLYLSHQEPVSRFLRSRLNDPDLADDLTSEVFMRMMTKISSYRDQSLPFHNWLYRIARNLVIDHYRKSRRRPSVSMETGALNLVDSESVEESLERRWNLEQVKNALEWIHPDQRTVVELRFLAGYSLEETALATQKSIANVRVLQHRGLASLKARMKMESCRWAR